MGRVMRVHSPLLTMLHLDDTYSLLPAKSVRILLELFQMLDIHGLMALNDVQFLVFMRYTTDLSTDKIMNAFDMLDIDQSGELDFDEFYLLACILIAVKDGDEKQFIYHHSRTVFDMMDEDGSNSITIEEFGHFSFLFNFDVKTVRRIFREFDISGDAELDFKEFRMFAMATIDKQIEMDETRAQKMRLKKRRVFAESQKTAAMTVAAASAAKSHRLTRLRRRERLRRLLYMIPGARRCVDLVTGSVSPVGPRGPQGRAAAHGRAGSHGFWRRIRASCPCTIL